PPPTIITLGPLLERSLRGALSLVSPVDCAGCGRPDIELCAPCRAKLRAAPLVSMLTDGTPFVSGLEYSGVVRDVVLAFKQSGRWRLGRELAPALAAAVAEIGAGGCRVLAVPSSPAGLRRRGYDPVELLVKATGEVPCRPGLRILRSSGAQKAKSRSERLRSRVGALRCSPRVAGCRVIVVDDVSTSGATLVEAARAARAAGAEVVGAACVAATPLASEAQA
ncbi:MAG: hypothetical protein JWP75_4000, partial [Frondihabitans sp.]|nr:hypothetical protein [Frondihabitans sp.]